MSNINRDYLIVLNPKTSKVTVPELNYYIYDKYTANLFVNLVTVENGKVVNMVDADQYKLVLHVLKPTNEIQTVEDIQVFNKEKALFQIELDQTLTKNIGRYKCELLTIDKTDHIVQSAKFSYRVKKSIYNDLDVVTETPQYPIIITLLDKLQDIDKYEEERRANEVARVAAEKARVKDYTDLRKTVTTDIDTMQQKIDSFEGKVQEVDNAVTQMRTNITDYQTKKNKELDNYKTQKDTQINTAIKGMETTIDKYKTEKDTEINTKITQQDTKIDSAINLQNKNIQASTKALNDKLDKAVQDQNNTIAANNQAQNKVISDAIAEQNKTINTVVENDKAQDSSIKTLKYNQTSTIRAIKKLQDKDVEHEERMTAIEAVDVEQNNRLDAIEIKNNQQDGRLNDVEAKNKKQDLDLKCLFAESHSERITLDNEVGNSVFLQNSKQGFATVDELKGNTLVNCNKDTDKELILNGNIDTSGYNNVTLTEGVDGGKVDISLEGNTMVNVCDQEDSVTIPLEKELTYLNISTEYTVQFTSTKATSADITLGGKQVLAQNITVGLNKINITTPETLTNNKLIINGVGADIQQVVVTPKVEQPFGYFKGMKSVGECEGNVVEVVAQNKNLFNKNKLQVANGSLYGYMHLGNDNNYTISITDKDTSVDMSQIYFGFTSRGIDANGGFFWLIENGSTYHGTNFTTDFSYFSFYPNDNITVEKITSRFDIQIEKGTDSTSYTAHKENKQTITHEPLRGLPNGTRDKYVIIDGKWYIERNCEAVQFKDLKHTQINDYQKTEFPDVIGFRLMNTGLTPPIMCDRFAYSNDRIINMGQLLTNKENINICNNGNMDEFFITIQKAKLKTLDFNGIMNYFTENPMEIIAKATTPTYEPIDYNPFEVYSATTHISNNSTIPCNMIIRNSGFNCILKPNTTYTVSSNNGLSSVTTKDSIGDGILRFYDKDTTSVTKMGNVLVLEGDYITGNPPIPAFFKGIESAFEQELVTDEKDKNYGKYKVNVKATNPDNSQQNNITFYLKEPLRGIGDVKDKVYVKEDKVVVERNCTNYVIEPTQIPIGYSNTKDIYMYNISVNNPIVNTTHGKVVCNNFPCDVNNAHGRNYPNTISTVVDQSVPNGVIRIITDKNSKTLKQWLQANPTTVIYQLATPVYEEVEYFDMKLFVEIFKDTTIIYNSNIPVTSTINYTYSTPLTDAVNTVSDISDQQDSMIIDMATQVATMQMMLM